MERAEVDAGSVAGDLRSDIAPEDIATSLFGSHTVAGRPEQRAQLEHLFDLLMSGLTT